MQFISDSNFSFSFPLHFLLVSHQFQQYALPSGGVAICEQYFHKLRGVCVCVNRCFQILYACVDLMNKIFQSNVNLYSLDTTKYKPPKSAGMEIMEKLRDTVLKAKCNITKMKTEKLSSLRA